MSHKRSQYPLMGIFEFIYPLPTLLAGFAFWRIAAFFQLIGSEAEKIKMGFKVVAVKPCDIIENFFLEHFAMVQSPAFVSCLPLYSLLAGSLRGTIVSQGYHQQQQKAGLWL